MSHEVVVRLTKQVTGETPGYKAEVALNGGADSAAAATVIATELPQIIHAIDFGDHPIVRLQLLNGTRPEDVKFDVNGYDFMAGQIVEMAPGVFDFILGESEVGKQQKLKEEDEAYAERLPDYETPEYKEQVREAKMKLVNEALDGYTPEKEDEADEVVPELTDADRVEVDFAGRLDFTPREIRTYARGDKLLTDVYVPFEKLPAAGVEVTVRLRPKTTPQTESSTFSRIIDVPNDELTTTHPMSLVLPWSVRRTTLGSFEMVLSVKNKDTNEVVTQLINCKDVVASTPVVKGQETVKEETKPAEKVA